MFVYIFVLNIREVHEPSKFAVEMLIRKLKRHKSTGIDKIPAELIKAGCRKILSEITILINSIWKNKVVFERWNDSIIAPIAQEVDKTTCCN
jgi:hypothetical protein